MALKNKNQSISLSAQSVISIADDEVVVLYLNATLDSANPGNMSINRIIVDNAIYREHHTECLADQTAFEDAVYAIVDNMTTKEAANETI